jgi:hypothetical protein
VASHGCMQVAHTDCHGRLHHHENLWLLSVRNARGSDSLTVRYCSSAERQRKNRPHTVTMMTDQSIVLTIGRRAMAMTIAFRLTFLWDHSCPFVRHNDDHKTVCDL